MVKVSLVKCKSYDAADVAAAVRHAVDLLGGMEKFVKRDERVLLKPNLLTDAAPDQGITTHPEVVRAVIRLLKPLTKNIYCGDSPSVWGEQRDIDRVYETTGIKGVCQEEGVELVYFTKPKMYGAYPLTEWLEKCDRLISLPKFKTHGFTVLTGGLKNLFGLVIGMYKIKIHRDNPQPDDLCKAIVDIYGVRRPDLTILDGIVAMEGEGPGSGGTLRPSELIAASPEALALDVVLAKIMGLEPADIPTNREAFRRGWQPADIKAIEIAGEHLQNCVLEGFRLPKTTFLNKMPKWAIDVIKQFLQMKVVVLLDKCRRCHLCQKSCPAGAIEVNEKGAMIRRRMCIYCLCCQEICPHGAIRVKKNFLLRLIGA